MQAANLQALGDADSSDSYYVVAAGGYSLNYSTSSIVDIYNSSSQTFANGPAMLTARAEFELTSMYNGTNEALATGGKNVSHLPRHWLIWLAEDQ